MESYQLKIAIADDHPVIVEGLRRQLEGAQIELVGTARDSTRLVQLLEEHQCNVLVTDYSMPGGEFGDGLPLLDFIRRRYPGVRVLVMTMMENPGVLQAISKLGITCIVSKSDDLSHLVPAIHVAGGGGMYYSPTIQKLLSGENGEVNAAAAPSLSKREAEVVRLYASGLGINEIAELLHRSKQTISSQKTNAMRKIGVTRDTDLVKYAMSVGLLSGPS